MRNIYIEEIEDKRKNLTQEEKNKLKHKLLYSRKPIDFLVYRFIETLEKDNNINLDLFYKNLVDLEIIIDDEEIIRANKCLKTGGAIEAYYLPAVNQVVLGTTFSLESLYHELFHVASTKKNNYIFSSGLNYDDNKYNLNDYLNEGYTQLLVKKYFKIKPDEFYYDNVHVANLFEDIIGEENLLKYYFDADFYHFADELLKLENGTKLYKFMKDRKIENQKFMKKFLKKIYIKALYTKFLNKEITQEQFEYKIAYFFKRFKFKNLDKECELILDNYKDDIKNKYENIYIDKNSDTVIYVKK